LAFTGQAPNLATVLPVGSGALALTGQTPTLQVAFVASPATGTLSLTGAEPQIVFQGQSRPDAAALTLTGHAPALVLAFVASPATGQLSLTGAAPALSLTVPVGAGTLTFTGTIPLLAFQGQSRPDAAVLTLTGHAPTVGLSYRLSVDSAALILTGQAPLVALDTVRLQPATGALAFTGHAPTITATESHLIAIPSGTLTFSGLIPGVQETTSTAPEPDVIVVARRSIRTIVALEDPLGVARGKPQTVLA
jgi:hypothetical protein